MSIKNATFLSITNKSADFSDFFSGSIQDLQYFNEKADQLKFIDCLPSMHYSIGFLPWDDKNNYVDTLNTSFAEDIGFIKLQIESKILPSSVITDALKKRCDEIKKDTGAFPTKKEKQELREDIEKTLLVKAFTKKSTILAAIHYKQKRLIVFSARFIDVYHFGSFIRKIYGEDIVLDLPKKLVCLPWQFAVMADSNIHLEVANKICLRNNNEKTISVDVDVKQGGLGENELKSYFNSNYMILGVDLRDDDQNAYSFHLTNKLQFKRIKFSPEFQNLNDLEEPVLQSKATPFLKAMVVNGLFNKISDFISKVEDAK